MLLYVKFSGTEPLSKSTGVGVSYRTEMSHAGSLLTLDEEFNVPCCLLISVVCGGLRIC